MKDLINIKGLYQIDGQLHGSETEPPKEPADFPEQIAYDADLKLWEGSLLLMGEQVKAKKLLRRNILDKILEMTGGELPRMMELIHDRHFYPLELVCKKVEQYRRNGEIDWCGLKTTHRFRACEYRTVLVIEDIKASRSKINYI